VHARVLLADGHDVGHDVEHPLEAHPHAVGRGRPRDGERRRGGGPPRGAGVRRDGDALAVEGQVEAVDVVAAPPGGLIVGAHVEAVVREADAERLDPGEVAAHGGVAPPDEVRVDMEAGVGEDAEVLVLAAVEVEGVAVAAREPRVAARHAGVEVADLHSLLEAKSFSWTFALDGIQTFRVR